jgi:hypothetical protein
MLGDRGKDRLVVRSSVDREETVGTSGKAFGDVSSNDTVAPFGGALTPLKKANWVGSAGSVWSREVRGSMTT